jgi:hypothetical protein
MPDPPSQADVNMFQREGLRATIKLMSVSVAREMARALVESKGRGVSGKELSEYFVPWSMQLTAFIDERWYDWFVQEVYASFGEALKEMIKEEKVRAATKS